MKRWTAFLGLLALLLAFVPGLADEYSFPVQGVSFLGEVSLLVTPDTAAAHAAELSAHGVSLDALLADFQVHGTVFAVFLEGGACVSLSMASTRETREWGSLLQMSDADRAALFSAFTRPPYEGAVWTDTFLPAIQCGYTLQAAGAPKLFAQLYTVERGMLYQLTATGGADLSMDALHAAALDVFQMTDFLPLLDGELLYDPTPDLPLPVLDDGEVTPLALAGFTGVTVSDMTDIRVQTLPGAEITLRTANDTLRSRADASGEHTFSVSTKRETTYAYAVTATAEGRAQSYIDFYLERRIDEESYEASYRRKAFPIERVGYANLGSAAAGTILQFRGKVGDFSSLLGYPCVLIYTQNPRLNVWEAPLWVQLVGPRAPLEMDGIYTVYGELTAETIAFLDKKGSIVQVPVVASQMVLE